MPVFGLLLAGLMQATAPSEATAQVEPPVTNPIWVARPDFQDLSQAYPLAAKREVLDGVGTIECVVSPEGRLDNCKIGFERPLDHGFGDAALGMSRLFRMRNNDAGGRSVVGRRVRIPIRFQSPIDSASTVAIAAPGAGPVGVKVDVDCRYQQSVLDNCFVWRSPAEHPEAAAAAIAFAETFTIPKLAGSKGRIALPIQFVPGVPSGASH